MEEPVKYFKGEYKVHGCTFLRLIRKNENENKQLEILISKDSSAITLKSHKADNCFMTEPTDGKLFESHFTKIKSL